MSKKKPLSETNPYLKDKEMRDKLVKRSVDTSTAVEYGPKPLFTGTEWSFELIQETWEEIDKIGKEILGFDYYEPSIEMITYEQMLDAYSSVAMPIMYNHWSFGKSFIQNEKAYKDGKMGLAYEVVINTNPCIVYLMENNSMAMQTLVMAHAGVGHNSFFKNNYLFKEWTDADAILDYLSFAKDYIAQCEQKYGAFEVEYFLDACHSLQNYGVDKYKRGVPLKKELQKKRQEEWTKYIQANFNEIWDTIPGHKQFPDPPKYKSRKWTFPEENILYFIEKNARNLPTWKREIIRIVRKIAQYFYPQMQTQLMNEGWATFTHYTILNELWDRGKITEGAYLEAIQSHSGVVFQPDYDSPYYRNINVYALGFAMMQDIKRICTNPDEEDKYWFPDIVNTDWKTTMQDIIENYRDESFVLQFLSPKVIKQFNLFALEDFEGKDKYQISATQSDEDVLKIREALSKQYSISYRVPQVHVAHVDREDNVLELEHIVTDERLLDYDSARQTMNNAGELWGDIVTLEYVNDEGELIEKVS